MAADPDLYRVLGVAPTAEHAEIRSAHRRLVHAVHPDRHAGASDAERQLSERRMREINEAWHVLGDATRRAGYDRSRRNGSGSGAARSSSQRPRPTGSARPSPRPPQRPPATPPARPPVEEDFDDEDDDDMVMVHPATFALLRFGPIVALVLVVAGLLVVTAIVGGGSNDREPEPVSDNTCILLLEGSDGALVDCSLPNDGKVVGEVDAPLECPEDTRYAQVGPDFYCIPR